MLLAALVALVVALAARNRGCWNHRSEPQANPRPIAARGDLAADEAATIELFEQCSRSVVYVSPMTARVRRSLFGFTDTVIETGTGSGFVWDEQGHVVTNFHVIQQADRCQVTLPDNTTYEAGLAGVAADKDIAVLRIEAGPDELAPIPIGTSNDLRVGQKVFAIGNPYGLDFTLTTGVVSALNRQIESVNGRTIQGVIQTDAAINPGNSGGPLLDSAGRLIGMNTTIYSQTGASAGIGFAIPVDTINQVVPQIIAHGRVIRPGLGIMPAGDDLIRRLGLNGVLILDVTAGSSAERAGLRPTRATRGARIVLGDVIIKVGPTPTPTNDAMRTALEQYQIGETVDVTVQRQSQTVVVPVTLQAIQ
jgi:S1-C subfamily serine protease